MKSPKEIAIEAAKAQPESYYSEPFTPHAWVISAIVYARNEGILEGRRQVEEKQKNENKTHGTEGIHGAV